MKTLVTSVLLIICIICTNAQPTVFPFRLWRNNAASGFFIGKCLYDSSISYDAFYDNPGHGLRKLSGCSLSVQSFYYSKDINGLNTVDTAKSSTYFDCAEANYTFQTARYFLIACRKSDSVIAFDKRYKDNDFYMIEFVDTLTEKTLGFGFSSLRCDSLDNLRKSYLLPCNRYDYYSTNIFNGPLYESLLYSNPNGIYLFEIIESGTGKAVGIRYNCINNEKEYVMYFR